MLACSEGRNNVVLSSWDDQGVEGDDPLLEGSLDLTNLTGLYLDKGHQNILVTGIRFRCFRMGIVVRVGYGDVFYRLSFDGTITQRGISFSMVDGLDYQSWENALNPSNDPDISDLLEPLLGNPDVCLRDYPTAAGGYSDAMLIGFCTFEGVGYWDTRLLDVQANHSNGSASIELGHCTTRVCVDHCTCTGCVDGVTSDCASSGHLVLANSFKDMKLSVRPYAPYDSTNEDGNGVDLKDVRPRTETVFDQDGNPLPTAIFDNLFDNCYNPIALHFCTDHVDVFSNTMTSSQASAILIMADVLDVVHPDDLEYVATYASFAVDDPSTIVPANFWNYTPMYGFHDNDRFEILSTGERVARISSVRLYRNIIDGATGYGIEVTNQEVGVWNSFAGSSDADYTVRTGKRYVGLQIDDLLVAQNTITNCASGAIGLGRPREATDVPPRAGSFTGVSFYNNILAQNGGYDTSQDATILFNNYAGDSDAWVDSVVLDCNVYQLTVNDASYPHPETLVRRNAPRGGGSSYLTIGDVQSELWLDAAGAGQAEGSWLEIYIDNVYEATTDLFEQHGDWHFEPAFQFLCHGCDTYPGNPTTGPTHFLYPDTPIPLAPDIAYQAHEGAMTDVGALRGGPWSIGAIGDRSWHILTLPVES